MNPLSTKVSWVVWVVLFSIFTYFAAVVMPATSKAVLNVSSNPDCVKILDLMRGAGRQEIIQSFDCLGPEGLTAYKGVETFQDIFYPLVYAAYFCFTLFALSSYCLTNRKLIIAVSLFPVLNLLADFIENHFIVRLILQYPGLNDSTIATFSFISLTKWSLFFVLMSMVVFFALWSLAKLIGKKKKV